MKLNNKIYPIKKEEFQTGDILLFHWKPLCKTPYDCCMTCFSNVIQCFTKSKYTHSAMVVRDPPWRKDLKGLYILESSLETFPDAEDNDGIFGELQGWPARMRLYQGKDLIEEMPISRFFCRRRQF